jgi:hypothetical protein
MNVTARLLPHVLSKGRSMMKRALIVIASVGILAVTLAVESANAQVNKTYSALGAYPWPAYPPQSHGWDRFGAPRTDPFYRYNPNLGAPRTDPFYRYNLDSPAATGGGSLGYNQFWKWKW